MPYLLADILRSTHLTRSVSLAPTPAYHAPSIMPFITVRLRWEAPESYIAESARFTPEPDGEEMVNPRRSIVTLGAFTRIATSVAGTVVTFPVR